MRFSLLKETHLEIQFINKETRRTTRFTLILIKLVMIYKSKNL